MVKLITAHSFHVCTKSTKRAVLFEITYGGGELLYVQSADKGNNKLTEHRAIFQRQRQNS